MGYVTEESLWPEMTGGSGSRMMMGQGMTSEPHPMDMLMARMDQLEDRMESKMSEMQAMLGHGQSVDKLTQKAESLVGEAFEVAMQPPATWKQYLEKQDKAGLVDMEYKELQNALKSKPKDVHKEAVHTMAALMRACL